MEQENRVGYFANLDYRMIKYIAQYLDISDILNFQITNSEIREQLNLKCLKVKKNKEEKVSSNDISLYLKLDIQEIFERIIGIYVSISTKDQGWASASYSSSWVSLTLINEEQDYKTHSDIPNEIILKHNFRVKQYERITKKIDKVYEKAKDSQIFEPTFLYKAKQGNYKNIGIVQKCQYPGWECHLRDAEIRIYYWD